METGKANYSNQQYKSTESEWKLNLIRAFPRKQEANLFEAKDRKSEKELVRSKRRSNSNSSWVELHNQEERQTGRDWKRERVEGMGGFGTVMEENCSRAATCLQLLITCEFCHFRMEKWCWNSYKFIVFNSYVS